MNGTTTRPDRGSTAQLRGSGEGAGRLPFSRALVYGLGLSGRAAAQLLLDEGIEVVAVDDRDPAVLAGDLTGREGFRCTGADDLGELPSDLEVVITSPGVPPERPLLASARARGIPVWAEVELAYRLLEGTVVGITGSNGKSTTTALAGALVAADDRTVEVCGNIGQPLSAVVEGPPDRVFVVELSSFQLEGVELFRPRVAALLNLAPDHLDRHHEFEAYVAAKARLFARQGEGDVAVLNADDPRVLRVELPSGVRRRTFSRRGPVEDGCFVRGDHVLEVAPGGEPSALFPLADLRLRGAHNLENAMAAALVARGVGVSVASLGEGLRGFRGLPHRMETVGARHGVTWIDDSKGTNVAATCRSLEGFADGSVHLILGGRGKGADFAALREPVSAKARAIYLIGESAAEIGRALDLPARTLSAGTLQYAVRAIAERAGSGEVALLSPACASFDQFESFVDRGRTFERLARALDGFVPAGERRSSGG